MAQNERVLVRNSADEKQVQEAKRKEKFNRDDELEDLRFVLSSKQGRRFLWRLISWCGPFKSIWSNSAAIHYNSGKADVGNFLMAETIDASKESFLMMQNECMLKQGEQNA